MGGEFGPWATTLDVGLGAMLGRFWKQRIRLLPPAQAAGPRASRQAAALVTLAAAVTLAMPLLLFSAPPAAAPEPTTDVSAASAPTAPPAESAQADLEPLPEGMPHEVIPNSRKPGTFLQPIGLTRVIHAPLTATGSLALDPTRLSRVHSWSAGEVLAIGTLNPPTGGDAATQAAPRELRVGDVVHKGDVLATIWSREVGEKKSDLLEALSRMDLDRAQLNRLESLRGSTNLQTLQEAAHMLEADRIAVDRIERTLRMWRLPESEITAVRAELKRIHNAPADHEAADKHWAEVDVRAPFDGTVLERNATVGDVVDTGVDLFKIADLSRLLVVVNVTGDYISALKALPPERRRWSIHAHGSGRRIAGTFDTIGDVINTGQQTTTVLGTVDNATGALHAGEFITAQFLDSQLHGFGLAVPATAIVNKGRPPGDPLGDLWLESDPAGPTFEWRHIGISNSLSGITPFHFGPDARGVLDPLRVGARVVVWGPAPPPAEE